MAKDQHSAVAFITPEDKNTIKEKYETAYANYYRSNKRIWRLVGL